MNSPSGVSKVAVPSQPSLDSKNRLRTSFFHISHDFFGGDSWMGHLRVLLDV
jgi:hypothetical protein